MLVVAAFAACNNEDYSGPDRQGVELAVAVAEGTEMTWKASDQIGVSVVALADYASDTNIAFAYDAASGAFSPTQHPIYLRGARQEIAAYYPYRGTENEFATATPILTTSEYQQPEQQTALDYRVATTIATREEPVACFTFNHAMSQLRLKFVADSGNATTVAYAIEGLVLNGYFDASKGVATLNEKDSSGKLSLTAEQMEDWLILLPQTASLQFECLYNDRVYRGSIADVTLVAGQCHTLTIQLNSSNEVQPSLTISMGESTNWQEGQGGSISSEEDK